MKPLTLPKASRSRLLMVLLYLVLSVMFRNHQRFRWRLKIQHVLYVGVQWLCGQLGEERMRGMVSGGAPDFRDARVRGRFDYSVVIYDFNCETYGQKLNISRKLQCQEG